MLLPLACRFQFKKTFLLQRERRSEFVRDQKMKLDFQDYGVLRVQVFVMYGGRTPSLVQNGLSLRGEALAGTKRWLAAR